MSLLSGFSADSHAASLTVGSTKPINAYRSRRPLARTARLLLGSRQKFKSRFSLHKRFKLPIV
jgi:hypothetical protein